MRLKCLRDGGLEFLCSFVGAALAPPVKLSKRSDVNFGLDESVIAVCLTSTVEDY